MSLPLLDYFCVFVEEMLRYLGFIMSLYVKEVAIVVLHSVIVISNYTYFGLGYNQNIYSRE